jgi:hypothetical protein
MSCRVFGEAFEELGAWRRVLGIHVRVVVEEIYGVFVGKSTHNV